MWIDDDFSEFPEFPEMYGEPGAQGGLSVPGDAGSGDDYWDEEDYDPVPFDGITAVDLDGDGVLETMVVHDGDNITVSYDLDGDGRADYETVFGPDGSAESWQDQQDEDGRWRWRRVEAGPSPVQRWLE